MYTESDIVILYTQFSISIIYKNYDAGVMKNEGTY